MGTRWPASNARAENQRPRLVWVSLHQKLQQSEVEILPQWRAVESRIPMKWRILQVTFDIMFGGGWKPVIYGAIHMWVYLRVRSKEGQRQNW